MNAGFRYSRGLRLLWTGASLRRPSQRLAPEDLDYCLWEFLLGEQRAATPAPGDECPTLDKFFSMLLDEPIEGTASFEKRTTEVVPPLAYARVSGKIRHERNLFCVHSKTL